MIQQQTILKVSDNTGVKKVKCLKILGGLKRKRINLGDIIAVSVITKRSFKKNTLKIKKGDVFLAIVVRLKKNSKKKDGVSLFLNDNSVSLLNKQKKIIATRFVGPISREFKYFKKVTFSNISIAGFY